MFLDSSVELHEEIRLQASRRVRPRWRGQPPLVVVELADKATTSSLILMYAGENSILS